MSIENATTHQQSDSQKKLQTKGAARPEGSDKLEEGQFTNDDFHVIAKKHGWTMGSYKNEDGSTGFIMTNGQSMFHFDVNGNIVMATGKPGQSGCGGKVVIHAKDHHEKTSTYNLHVLGNDDESEKEGSKESGAGVKKSAPFSIYVEGDVAIESQGGDVGLKGDNVTINALNTLTLKSGETINFEAGEGQGKVNLVATDFNADTSFTRFTTSGGFYIDGSGEFSVNQKDQIGASASINTIGDINNVATGNYLQRVTGNYQITSDTGHFLVNTTRGGFGRILTGDDTARVGGIKKLTVIGKSVAGDGDPPAAYGMKLGQSVSGSLDVNAASFVNVKAVGPTVISSTNINIIGKAAVTMTGKTIFLN